MPFLKIALHVLNFTFDLFSCLVNVQIIHIWDYLSKMLFVETEHFNILSKLTTKKAVQST